MHVDYAARIQESAEELAGHEWRLRGTKPAVRVQALRLLKTGQAGTVGEVAQFVGYSPTQVNRWLHTYQTQGLEAVVKQPVHPGRPSQLTDPAQVDLEAAMTRGEIATLADAQQYLAEHWGIVYQSLNGVCQRFKRLRMRKKTGRRRHRYASAAQQDAFKKTLPLS